MRSPRSCACCRAFMTSRDYGQAWNMPCAPTQTPREILALGAAAPRRSAKDDDDPAPKLVALRIVRAVPTRGSPTSPTSPSPGIAPTGSTRASSPPRSDATRHPSNAVRNRRRCPSLDEKSVCKRMRQPVPAMRRATTLSRERPLPGAALVFKHGVVGRTLERPVPGDRLMSARGARQSGRSLLHLDPFRVT